jgi:hypothetical protein
MKRTLTIRRIAKGAGAVVLALVVLDLIGLVITAYVGAELVEKAKAEGLSGLLKR